MNIIIKKYLLALLCICSVYKVGAQRDFSWQDNYHNVDDWSDFIQFTPSTMGPFALAVPSIYEAKVGEQAEVEGGYSYYKYSLGDAPTHAATTRFYYPILAQRVAVEVQLMPYESYSYSDEVADEFHTINTSGGGTGDIYINTYIQLLRQTVKRPDVTLRYGLKTASGSNINDARHTDSPGYYMDLSVGKDVFALEEQIVRFYALAGFYCWQQPEGSKMQNDAFMYGAGMSYHNDDFLLKFDMGGYGGYKKSGDSPLLMRIQADVPISSNFKLRGLYEKGISDFPYSGYHLRLVYSFAGNWGE